MIEPCRPCGQPADRLIGTVAHCHPCAEALLHPIRDSLRERMVAAEGFSGTGVRVGPFRPEHGRHMADLTCTDCSAGWVGVPGEPCGWCHERMIAVHEEQRILTLTPPDHASGQTEWAARIARAVDAGIITEADADAAWEKAKRRVA